MNCASVIRHLFGSQNSSFHSHGGKSDTQRLWRLFLLCLTSSTWVGLTCFGLHRSFAWWCPCSVTCRAPPNTWLCHGYSHGNLVDGVFSSVMPDMTLMVHQQNWGQESFLWIIMYRKLYDHIENLSLDCCHTWQLKQNKATFCSRRSWRDSRWAVWPWEMYSARVRCLWVPIYLQRFHLKPPN